VNIPFAILAAAGAYFVIREPEGGRNRNPLDIPGVLLSTLGLVALVYGFTRAESDGWGDTVTVSMFVASVVLLAAFAVVESRVKAPLLPLRVVTDRNRGGIYLSLGLAIIGMFGLFLFLTYYLQVVKGYSPVKTGFAFLPMVAGMITGSTQIGTRLMTRIPARLLMGPGFLVAALGMLVLTQLKIDSSYGTQLLPAMVLLGLGMGTAFMPAMSLATQGVQPRDAGVASAMVNTSQQVGGAIGTALLNTIAASATTSYIKDHIAGAASRPQAELVKLQGMVHGYSTAIWFAVGILTLAALIAFTFVNAGRPGATTVASGEGVEDEVAVPVVAH
jgi:MFS family permease